MPAQKTRSRGNVVSSLVPPLEVVIIECLSYSPRALAIRLNGIRIPSTGSMETGHAKWGTMKNNTISSTGTAGFIGFPLERPLLSEGYKIASVDGIGAHVAMRLVGAVIQGLKDICSVPGDLA